MKEYIEREAVLNLLEKINPVDFGSMFDYSAHGAVNECLREIRYGVEDIPAADVVPVVRCRECIYRDGTPGQPNILCGQMHDDDFCSYGQRKGGEHEVG